jgi:hypothetical protein
LRHSETTYQHNSDCARNRGTCHATVGGLLEAVFSTWSMQQLHGARVEELLGEAFSAGSALRLYHLTDKLS